MPPSAGHPRPPKCDTREHQYGQQDARLHLRTTQGLGAHSLHSPPLSHGVLCACPPGQQARSAALLAVPPCGIWVSRAQLVISRRVVCARPGLPPGAHCAILGCATGYFWLVRGSILRDHRTVDGAFGPANRGWSKCNQFEQAAVISQEGVRCTSDLLAREPSHIDGTAFGSVPFKGNMTNLHNAHLQGGHGPTGHQ